MVETKDVDLVSKLSPEEKAVEEFRLNSICPDDGKYGESADKLRDYLSPRAEWLACVKVQRTLLETRVDFGQAPLSSLDELDKAIPQISPLNISLLEDHPDIRHDQLAVLEEIGRFVSPQTKALLHPGTTSYDILDTARAYLFRGAWWGVIRPKVGESVRKMCDLAEKSHDILQVGRTHLQNTSPVPFGTTLAGYAARLAERTQRIDESVGRLKGKISGIVGTGASIDAVIGKGESLHFESRVLQKLGLEADLTATQIVQRESLADFGHGLTTLMHVLGDFSEDIRKMYSSAINEVTSRDNKARLGGSSADATKNNPIQYENMSGKVAVVESGMRVLYAMIQSDFQRDLRNSVQGRYQPQAMMAQVYESFSRLNKSLPQLSINEDKMDDNLQKVRQNPGEAMVAILRGAQWVHPQYGVGHDFVKEMAKVANREKHRLVDVCLRDEEFKKLYDSLPENKRMILLGDMSLYTGSANQRAQINMERARGIVE